MKQYVKNLMCLLLTCVLLAGMLPMTAVADSKGTGNFSVCMFDQQTDKEVRVNVGDTVEIPVLIKHVDSRNYNSFDISICYDADMLELVAADREYSGASVTSDVGSVRLIRYGEDLETGKTAFTLNFKVKKAGRTAIQFDTDKTKVGIRENAQSKDAYDAVTVNKVTVVTNSQVTFDSNGGSAVEAQNVTYGEKLQKPADPIRRKYLFKGWFEDLKAETPWNFEKDTVTKAALTLYAKWEQALFSVTAKILDHNGEEYHGEVDVKLMRGNTLIASTTGNSGSFTFPEVEAGMYNLVAVYTDKDGEHTKTELIDVDHDGDYTLKLPAPGANSQLSISDNAQTPSIMVGGLDLEAENLKKSEATVIVLMNVEGQTESEVEKEDKAIVDAVTGEVGNDTTVEYVDITIQQTVTDSNGSKTTNVSETTEVLEIVIPYDGPVDENNPRVFRYHNNELQEFDRNSSREDGTFYCADGYIHLFTQYFSKYIISYDASYDVTFDDNYEGGSTARKTTGGDGKLDTLPSDPVRENYVFKGWYTAKTGGTEVTTNTVFTGDCTVYAQWGGHSITVSAGSDGTVTVNPTEAAGGQTVVITVTPKSGYEMKTLTVTDANGKNVTVRTDNNGKYSFEMPNSKVTVKVTFNAKSTSTADKSNPKTGDDFNLAAWNTVAMTSLLALALLIHNEKKRCRK